jgi:hypothetical protein
VGSEYQYHPERLQLPKQLRRDLEVDEIVQGGNPFGLPGAMFGLYYDVVNEEWASEAPPDAIVATAASLTLGAVKRMMNRLAQHGDIFGGRRAALAALMSHGSKRANDIANMADSWPRSTNELDENFDGHFGTFALMIAAGSAGAQGEVLRYYQGLYDEYHDEADPEVQVLMRHLGRLRSVIKQGTFNASEAKGKLRKFFATVQSGEYDGLINAGQFGAIDDALAAYRLLPESYKEQHLDFRVLPPDTNLRELAQNVFDESTDSEKTHVDLRRIAVLAQVRELAGANKCYFARGLRSGRTVASETGERIDEDYIVLVIQHFDQHSQVTGEDALAISPIARKHAAYLVRHDVSDGVGWRDIFQLTKNDARQLGARRLKFTTPSGQDRYAAMQEKIFSLLTCDTDQFMGELKQGRDGAYRLVYRRALGSRALNTFHND